MSNEDLQTCDVCSGGVLAYTNTNMQGVDHWKCLNCASLAFRPNDGAIRWVKLNWTGPETWQAYIKGNFYLLEDASTRLAGAWCMGYSHRPGDSDSVMRGVYYTTLDAAKKFCLEYAGVKS